jgi:DNA-binding CsgD family transcriptional regulator
MNHNLTEREKDILRQVSEGKTCKEIGNIKTLRNQLIKIREKLGAENSAHAVAIAIRRGII